MGGTKSKPVVETARQVLAKRKAEAESLGNVAATQATKSAVATGKLNIDVRYDSEKALKGANYTPDKNDLSAEMVHELSKWDYFKETTKGTQILDKNAKIDANEVISASVLRMAEEKDMDKKMAEIARSNLENNTSIPLTREVKGRISEAKLIEMYNKFRDAPKGSYTARQASIEFGLPESTVEVLLEVARTPLLVSEKGIEDLLVAK